jgi:colicin import membrane protein
MAGGTLSENDLPKTDGSVAASPGYADKVARRVRANVLAPFDIQGNPSAVIAVTCAPNGALLSATMQRSSGNPQWDSAVLTAVEKSDPMPRDVDGTAPASFLITFQPKS